MRTRSPEKQLSFRQCLPQVDAYLREVMVAPDDPAILFDWDRTAMQQLVRGLNAQQGNLADPVWLTRPSNGRVSVNSVVDDIMAALEEVAGGRWGRVCLAPNNAIQFGAVLDYLNIYVQHNPLIQLCLENHVTRDAVVRIGALSEHGTAAAAHNFPPRNPPPDIREFYV